MNRRFRNLATRRRFGCPLLSLVCAVPKLDRGPKLPLVPLREGPVISAINLLNRLISRELPSERCAQNW
jgi:hypothetical protein